MSYGIYYRTTRRAPKLSTPALAKAYGRLLKKESERNGKSEGNKESAQVARRARS